MKQLIAYLAHIDTWVSTDSQKQINTIHNQLQHSVVISILSTV